MLSIEKKMSNFEKKIGRTESVDFPELEISELSAKIDTGAYGIAIHVDEVNVENDILTFVINQKKYTWDKFKTITVKSSFGRIQKRFSIFTKIKLGNQVYKFFVSLTCRKNMRHPVLIGRRFLYKFNYIVDVKQKNIYDRDKEV